MRLTTGVVIGLTFFLSVAARSDDGIPKNPDPTLIDAKTSPCEDFYQYACGTWMKNAKIPSDRPSWDRSFTAIWDHNQKVLKEVLENYSKGKFEPANPYAGLLGDFYASCMDKKAREKATQKVLPEQLKSVEGVTKENLGAWLADAHLRQLRGFFWLTSSQDLKNPEQVIADISQEGMGLPTRDYYFDESSQGKELIKKYIRHIAKMFELAGEKKANAAKMAETVFKVESGLAKNALTPVQMRDPQKLYNKISLEDLKKATPGFSWDDYLKGLGLKDIQTVNVQAPEYLKSLGKLLVDTPLDELKTYLKAVVISDSSWALSDRFYNENFAFFRTTLMGVKEPPPRWKTCTGAANNQLGFALGRSFIDLTFKGDSKEKAVKMIEALTKEQAILIKDAMWMDSKTRKAALEKLGTIFNQIAYPEKWRSYDGVKAKRDSYVGNYYQIQAFNNHYELDKIGKPLDKNEWYMTPAMVNAYYDPQVNKIVFPAGILQPVFFHNTYADVANYGAIGVVMGHELSHGFDDQGRQFDKTGAMKDWWTPKSAEVFTKQAQCLAKQFDTFPAAGGGFINGQLTLGENIGDQGGLKLSYYAWKNSLPKEVVNDTDAFKKAQKDFFLAFGQSWCQKSTDAFEQMITKSDPHPPARYRVNGPLMNFVEFSKAYECAANTKMAPENRCVVW